MSHNELLRSLFKNNENPIEAKIIGELPCWLAGTLFRYWLLLIKINLKISEI
jgi:hypothetical protein